jgi:hypothetical protein
MQQDDTTAVHALCNGTTPHAMVQPHIVKTVIKQDILRKLQIQFITHAHSYGKQIQYIQVAMVYFDILDDMGRKICCKSFLRNTLDIIVCCEPLAQPSYRYTSLHFCRP